MRTTLLSATFVLVTLLQLSSASAQDADPFGVAIELGAGAQLTLDDSAQFSDQDPSFLMGLAGGLYLSENLRLALIGKFDLDDDARHNQVLGNATYFVDLRVVTLFAGLGLGRYWREVGGNDWSFEDEGFLATGDLGVRVGIAGPLSVSALFTYALAESQHDSPAWTHAAQAGLSMNLKI